MAAVVSDFLLQRLSEWSICRVQGCADLIGLNGIRADRPEDIGPTWERALTSDVPAVLEMVTDPNVPPHFTPKQAKAYLSALLHRYSDAIGTVVASAKQWWGGVFSESKK